jgi:Flp pilus assembly protein TadD
MTSLRRRREAGEAGAGARRGRVEAMELGRDCGTEDVLSIIALMTRARYAAVMLLCLVLPVIAAAQSKGNGKISGKILDDQGKPAAGVQVRAMRTGDQTGLEAKTNDKGEWQMSGMAAGDWNFEFVKDGFDPQRMSVKIADKNNPPVEMKLTKAVADPNVEIQAQMKKADDFQREGKIPEARKTIEDVLAKYPQVTRLNAFLAQLDVTDKNYDKAVEHLQLALDKEPDDLELKMFMAEVMTMKGDKAGAQKILDSVDPSKVQDPTVFINQAIQSINAGQADDALAMLDKVIKAFPTRPDVYYYRGRANIAAKKLPEAKADLEKFVSMAPPTARELPDAKNLLEKLKDVK